MTDRQGNDGRPYLRRLPARQRQYEPPYVGLVAFVRRWLLVPVLVAAALSIIASSQTVLRSITDEWFSGCIFVVDKRLGPAGKDPAELDFGVAVNVVGTPPEKARFIFSTPKYRLDRIALHPIGDPDSKVRSDLRVSMCPGDLCEGKPDGWFDDEVVAEAETQVHPLTNGDRFRFVVTLKSNDGPASRSAEALEVLIGSVDPGARRCRVEPSNAWNTILGMSAAVRFGILVFVVALLGVLVKRLSPS